MFKTKDQIEEMADAYKSNFHHEECLDRDDLEFIENDEDEQFVSLNEIDRVARGCHHHTYQVAYSQAQQDIKEACCDGFNGWVYKYPTKCDLRDFEKPNHNYYVAKEAWQAAKIDSMKELQEKDAEIKKLKEEIRNLIRADLIQTNREDVLPATQEATHYNWLDDQNEKLEAQYQEAVKDIDWLLNKEYSIVRVKLSSKKETMTCMKHLVEDQDKVQEIKTKYGLNKKEG